MASCLVTNSQLLGGLWKKKIFPSLLPAYILLPVHALQQSLAIFCAMSSTCLWGHRSCFPPRCSATAFVTQHWHTLVWVALHQRSPGCVVTALRDSQRRCQPCHTSSKPRDQRFGVSPASLVCMAFTETPFREHWADATFPFQGSLVGTITPFSLSIRVVEIHPRHFMHFT